MVKDTGETLRADAYRQVNSPQPVEVEEDAAGMPLAVKIPRQPDAPVSKSRRAITKPLRQAISDIDESWRIDDEWWRQEKVSRLYYALRLASGHRLVLYKDLTDGIWYRQNY